MLHNLIRLLLLTTIPSFGIAHLLQAAETFPQMARDAKGRIIPSNPANLPYKLIQGVPEYVIGVGDLLEITLQRADAAPPGKITVPPTGKISYSILQDIQAAGLTPSELRESLASRLAPYLRIPLVEVAVAEYRSKRVIVLGAVSTAPSAISGVRTGPGIYGLKGPTTALSQLLEVGGPQADARLGGVQLTRGGRVYTLNLRRALSEGDLSQDVILENQDILFVPGVGFGQFQVLVFGQVTSPGIHLIEKPFLAEALTAAQGFTANAVESRITVIRPGENPNHPTFFKVNARKLYAGDFSQNLPLEEGDVINVGKEWFSDVNHFLSQINPVLEALFIPATVVRAYTTGGGVIPILQGPGGISVQAGQTVSIPAGVGGAVTPTVPTGAAPKPAEPEKQK